MRYFANGKLVPKHLWKIYDTALRYIKKHPHSRAIVSIGRLPHPFITHIPQSNDTYEIVKRLGGTYHGCIMVWK